MANNSNGNNRYPVEEFNGCCYIDGKPRCMCLPYKDAWLMFAQFLSIFAVALSRIWFVTFWLGFVAFILLQICWCCRQSRFTLLFASWVSAMAALSAIGASVYIANVFPGNTRCSWGDLHAWSYDDDDQDYYWVLVNSTFAYKYREDRCDERQMVIVAAVCGGLWSLVAECLILFVSGGRHASSEHRHTNPDRDDATVGSTVVGDDLEEGLPTVTGEPSESPDNDGETHKQLKPTDGTDDGEDGDAHSKP